MTQFEHFEPRDVEFEQHNSTGIVRVHEGAAQLLGDRDAVSADIVDDHSKTTHLSAEMHEAVIELGAITTDAETTTENRYRLDSHNQTSRLSRLQEGEWFLVDPKEPTTAVYIQDAHKIVIRLVYADAQSS